MVGCIGRSRAFGQHQQRGNVAVHSLEHHSLTSTGIALISRSAPCSLEDEIHTHCLDGAVDTACTALHQSASSKLARSIEVLAVVSVIVVAQDSRGADTSAHDSQLDQERQGRCDLDLTHR